jgi:hypothetical protein
LKGENCSNAIVWRGEPLCVQTNGKTGSSQMPGSILGSGSSDFGTINGVTCEWNNRNDNDVWIKFKPNVSGAACISISGLRNSLQSIVVSDANRDNDNNPCSQVSKLNCFSPCISNDPNWNVVSCPRNSIYTSTSGGGLNQQHCFIAEEGRNYYLIIDGNLGAESPVYITGVSGLPAILSLKDDIYIRHIRKETETSVEYVNGILRTQMKDNLSEKQNILIFDVTGKLIYRKSMMVKGVFETNIKNYLSHGTNLIKVTIENKTYDQFIFKILK